MTSLLDAWARAPVRFREKGTLLTVADAAELRCALVYVLCDEKGESFYVGKTTKPALRFKSHGSANGLNLKARTHYQALGSRVRVSIVVYNPLDINVMERLEIAKRPWCLNIVTPGHWAWGLSSAKKAYRGCVSDYVIRKLADTDCAYSREEMRVLRRTRNAMSAVQRYQYELEVFGDMLPYWQVDMMPWAQEALSTLEELEELDFGQFQKLKWRVECAHAAAEWQTRMLHDAAQALVQEPCHGSA